MCRNLSLESIGQAVHDPTHPSTANRIMTPTGLARRDFLGIAGAAGAALCCGPFGFAALPARHTTLPAALSAAGFDPNQPENFLAVFAADTHCGYGTQANILPPIIREINTVSPRPAFFCLDGDLICTASLSFGHVPNAKQKEKAVEEFRLLERDLALLAPEIPTHLLLGNHDTNPEESDEDPELFHTVFPARRPYYSFDVNGVHVVCLNGGSSGRIADPQRRWFRGDVRNHAGPGKTVVVVCHQPSLGSVTAERGITRAIREGFADADGEFWFVGGHTHANGMKEFRLPGGNTITQISVTTANPEIWGDENHPGYWLFGFSRGRLAVRIFRKSGENAGYAIGPMPGGKALKPLPLPFEGREDILWKVMVGEGDQEFLVEAKAAWCLNYWHYNRRLVFRFPLSLAQEAVGRVAVLQTRCYREEPGFFVSIDGQTWQAAADVRHEANAFTSFLVPPECRQAGVVFVKLEKCTVSGLALLR